ncbi:HK97-gp10 family putative phage morphogenesis protein [Pararhodobacter aggregans]
MANDGGLSSFQKRMRAIPKAARAAVRPALDRSAEELVALQRSLAPVDEGDLVGSIGWTDGPPPAGSLAVATMPEDPDLAVTVYAGNEKVFHARWVEFGTQAAVAGARVANPGAGNRQSKRGRFSYRSHPGTTAQPFFYPAYRLLKKRITARIKRAIGKAVKAAR